MIFSYLEQFDLKLLRFVSKEMAAMTRTLLFKSVSVSYLPDHLRRFQNVVQDPELCQAVEDLVFYEIEFEPQHERVLEYMTIQFDNLIQRHCSNSPNPYYSYNSEALSNSLPRYGDGISAFTRERDHGDDGDRSLANKASINEIVSQVNIEYQNQRCFMQTERGFEILSIGLNTLRNLKRVTTRDSGQPGIMTDTIFQPPALEQFRAFFPVSEAAFRNVAGLDSNLAPSHGFDIILLALAVNETKVETLVTERTVGFLKRGLPIQFFSSSNKNHAQHIKGFRGLRRLEICVDTELLENGRYIRTDYRDLDLASCIAAAEQLEYMELSVTHKTQALNGQPHQMHGLLPCESLHKLKTLVLEGPYLDEKETVDFLRLQSGHLQDLTLWDVTLVLAGRWHNAFTALSLWKSFRLQSLILGGLSDADVRAGVDRGEIPSRVANKEVLDYVNQGGVNPFSRRKWKQEPRDDAGADADEEASVNSEYSDGSVWNPKNIANMSHVEADEDPNGPEFDTDYDFDAESDSEHGSTFSTYGEQADRRIVLEDFNRDQGQGRGECAIQEEAEQMDLEDAEYAERAQESVAQS